MTFYVVATPIGNLEDITYRAVRILGEVDVILCEDTRTTRKLLDRYDIHTTTISYHAQSSDSKEDQIIDMIKEGKILALVSDAGTPCISDPGVKIIRKILEEIPDVQISPIPGPSALVSALSVSGMSVAEFMFLGFVPHKKGRQQFFKRIADNTMPTAFYESPHRIIKTFESLNDILTNDREVVIGRELTKIYEEVLRGPIGAVREFFEHNPDHIRGEFVVMVEGNQE